MRFSIGIVAALWISGNLLSAFAQDNTVRSGFAVVTLLSGNIAGVVSTENLINTTSSAIEHAVVAPSPLITSASFLVPVGPAGGNTTAIAIANPSSGAGGVNLILTDSAGGVVLNTTFSLGPFAQFSRFLNEFVSVEPAGFSTPLLLTVVSEIPVSILVLNFHGDDFVAIPLNSLSPVSPVAVQPIPAPPTTQAPVVQTASTGFGLGVAGPPAAPQVVLPPGTAPTATVPVTTTIGGNAFVFATVATGGGWSSEIAIGNTSATSQLIRIDFFSRDGTNTNSLTDIVIAPQGVFFFSTEQASVLR